MQNVIKKIESQIKNWWIFELLGAIFIVVSIMVFSFPLASYAGLVIYFAVSFLISGILRSVFAVANKEQLENWGWYFAGGLIDFLLGAFMLLRLDIAAAALPYYVGFYLLLGGIAAIAKSIDLRGLGGKEHAWLLVTGVLTVLLAGLIIFNPIIGVLTVMTTTAVGFMMMGFFYVILGFRLRRFNSHKEQFFSGKSQYS